MIRDIDNYDGISQSQFYTYHMHKSNKHKCEPLGPFNPGQIEEVGSNQKPLFKLEMSKLNDIIGR